LQFGLQSPSSSAHSAWVYPLAGVLHLERGDVGVALGCGNPGVTQNLLHDTDVSALLDQQGRRRVPGIVHRTSRTRACLRTAFHIRQSSVRSIGPPRRVANTRS